jgi:hypothetical protein
VRNFKTVLAPDVELVGEHAAAFASIGTANVAIIIEVIMRKNFRSLRI